MSDITDIKLNDPAEAEDTDSETLAEAEAVSAESEPIEPVPEPAETVMESTEEIMESTEEEEPSEEKPGKEKNKKSRKRILPMVLTLFFTGISALAIFGIRFMFHIWAGGSIQELVYTMTGNLEGFNKEMLVSGILQILVPMVLCIAAYILLQRFLFSKKRALYFHLFNTVLVLSMMTTAAFSIHSAWTRLGVTRYLAQQGIIELHNAAALLDDAGNQIAGAVLGEAMKYANADEQTLLEIQQKRLDMSFIDANFVDPKDVEIVPPKESRNLILIFLESMEMTYADKDNGGAYDVNYIPELTALSEENENFSGSDSTLNGAEVMTYSTWTMGGIFAQTAGLPLNIPVGRNQMDTQEVFLPAVTSLGDILKDYGYNQAFQCGSDVTFGGRKAYFSTHGDFTFHDLAHAWAEGYVPTYRKVWWGYEDEHLFEIAKDKITDLASRDEPFNYTMLTVDTHYPDGYMCDLCGNDKTFTTSHWYTTPYGNVLSCSSRQVIEFINWIKEQDFYENTTVVLLGDHLTMDTNFCSDIDSDYVRKTYVTYMNSAVEPELHTQRRFVTEDSFPTILASMGFKIVGNKLALGTNLFSSVPTLLEEYDTRAMDAGITEPSDYMNSICEDVDVGAAEEKYNVYHASIDISDPDPETGTYTITVKDITSSRGVSKISLALSTYEDESDTTWVTAHHQTDDTYQAVISKSTYDYNPDGILKVEAYVYDWSWVSHFLNKAYIHLSE